MRDAIEAAAFAKQGTWPTQAGSLDQPAVLLEAVRRVWAEQDAHRREQEPSILEMLRSM